MFSDYLRDNLIDLRKYSCVQVLRETPVRPLRNNELHYVHSWTVHEKWNPGLFDAHVFNKADPGSLIAVEVDGAPVGVLSHICLTSDFGFAGCFVLAPHFRNLIYGWVLIQAGLKRMGTRCIGAEAEPRWLRIYEKYDMHPRSTTECWQGLAHARHPVAHEGITKLNDDLLPVVIDYDAKAFGVPRAAFINQWIHLPDSLALAFVRQSKVFGFGVIRKVYQGYRIGPLQADHPDIASALFDALANFAGDEPVSIDCPDQNPEALLLVRNKGLRQISTSIRIFRGDPPPDAPQLVYGRMSLALG